MPIILDGTTGITTPGITNTGTFVFQGPVQVPAGSAATASITTAAGANTGIFFPSSSSVAITTAGTEKVSVGTGLIINDGGADFDTRIEGDTDANLFFVDASTDRIGIGTSSPSTKLHVVGGAATEIRVVTSGDLTTTGASFLRFGGSNSGTSGYLGYGGTGNTYDIYNGLNGPLEFYTNASKKMVLDASGNLGLGVTPSAWWSSFKAMQVGTYAGIASGSGVSNYFNNAFFDGTNFKYLNTATAAWYQQDGNQHKWYFANSGTAGNNITFTQIMYAGGDYFQYANGAVSHSAFDINIGVGAASWNYGYIRLGQNNLFCLTWGGGASGYGDTVTIKNPTNGPLVFGTNNTERARFTSNGEFLVNSTGTGSGSVNFVGIENSGQVDYGIVIKNKNTSTDDAIAFFNSSNSRVGYISFTTSATTYNTSSDRRLKDNVANSDDAGSLIDAINIIKHDWKAGGHVRYGVIAQDLHQIAPEAVAVGDPDDVEEFKKPWGVDYSKLVPMLIKEVQSLRARLAAAGI